MKMQKKFWIRENQSIGLWTFIGCLIACLNVMELQSSFQDLWRNFYFVADYFMGKEDTAYARFLAQSRALYPWIILYVLVVSILLFHNLNKNKTKEWIASMPLRQKDIFWYKFKQGIMSYTIPMVVYSVGSIALMIINRGWIITNYLRFSGCQTFVSNENPLIYVKVLLMMWCWITAAYMIFFFAQVICRSTILAGLTGYGMFMTTGYLGGLLYLVAESYKVNWLKNVAFILYRSYSHIFRMWTKDGTLTGWAFDLFGFFAPMTEISDYRIYLPEIGVMAVTFAGFFIMARYYFRRMNHPEVEGLFVSGLMRAFVLYGFGYCMMFPFVFLFVDTMELGVKMLGISVVAGAIPAVLIHFILRRRGY